MTPPAKKIALVTGGTSGIGAAICLELANAGITVATNYRNEEKARKWRAEVQDMGLDIHYYQADVTDYDACSTMIDGIHDTLGTVNILINNAGVTNDSSLRKMGREQWKHVIDINLNGIFNVTHQLIHDLCSGGWGRVVNISSINAQKGQFGQANYSAAKAGVHGFTMSLAQELANKGVTVNTISPGYIATDMVTAIPEKIRQAIISQIPLKRLGKPEEVAALTGFLCTEKAAFITGANLSINGGQYM